jgi:hypothetical protein
MCKRGVAVRRNTHCCHAQTHISRCCPQDWFTPKADAHEDAAQLDTSTVQTAHLQDAIAAAQPAQHCGLVGDLLAAVPYAHPQHRGVRLCSGAVDRFPNDCVHPAAASSCGDCIRFGRGSVWQWKRRTDRAEACQVRWPAIQSWNRHLHLRHEKGTRMLKNEA